MSTARACRRVPGAGTAGSAVAGAATSSSRPGRTCRRSQWKLSPVRPLVRSSAARTVPRSSVRGLGVQVAGACAGRTRPSQTRPRSSGMSAAGSGGRSGADEAVSASADNTICPRASQPPATCSTEWSSRCTATGQIRSPSVSSSKSITAVRSSMSRMLPQGTATAPPASEGCTWWTRPQRERATTRAPDGSVQTWSQWRRLMGTATAAETTDVVKRDRPSLARSTPIDAKWVVTLPS
ncbi:hypothetical protein ACFQY4_38055 [Catellatospora bangladeshensis]|uniref:hypothetical protein n=1 Tax=Catellatospora bangladeshensis TaxID=310355 RepID=UPI003612A409